MVSRRFGALIGLTVVTFAVLSLAQQAASPPATEVPAVNLPRIVVPSGTTIPVELRNTINTRTAQVGQAIYCQSIYPITLGDRIVIPAGTYLKGAVTQVIRPGRVKGRAQIGLRFDTITLPSGVTRPVRGTLSGFSSTGNEDFKPEEGRIKGETSKGQDAGKIATTATQGAIIGGWGSRSGKGAGIGAAAGGVGALIWVLASRGRDVVLPTGTNLELQLSTPLSFDRDETEAPTYRGGPVIPPREVGP